MFVKMCFHCTPVSWWTGWVWGLPNSLERDLWFWANFANTFSLLLPLVQQVIWTEWSQNGINYNQIPPLQWGSIFSSFVPLHIIHAYSILGIFPSYEILPKLNWSNPCFQDLSEVSQKHSHILAPDNLVQSSSRPNINLSLMTNFYFCRLVV